MKLIERKQYLDKMIGVIGTPDIKVLTGVRRSGKSKLLEAFKAYVQKNVPDANIIHINLKLEFCLALRIYMSIITPSIPSRKLNTIMFSSVEMEDGPFQRRAFLPPVANLEI